MCGYERLKVKGQAGPLTKWEAADLLGGLGGPFDISAVFLVVFINVYVGERVPCAKVSKI